MGDFPSAVIFQAHLPCFFTRRNYDFDFLRRDVLLVTSDRPIAPIYRLNDPIRSALNIPTVPREMLPYMRRRPYEL
jgi:hypothetical protein